MIGVIICHIVARYKCKKYCRQYPINWNERLACHSGFHHSGAASTWPGITLCIDQRMSASFVHIAYSQMVCQSSNVLLPVPENLTLTCTLTGHRPAHMAKVMKLNYALYAVGIAKCLGSQHNVLPCVTRKPLCREIESHLDYTHLRHASAALRTWRFISNDDFGINVRLSDHTAICLKSKITCISFAYAFDLWRSFFDQDTATVPCRVTTRLGQLTKFMGRLHLSVQSLDRAQESPLASWRQDHVRLCRSGMGTVTSGQSDRRYRVKADILGLSCDIGSWPRKTFWCQAYDCGWCTST